MKTVSKLSNILRARCLVDLHTSNIPRAQVTVENVGATTPRGNDNSTLHQTPQLEETYPSSDENENQEKQSVQPEDLPERQISDSKINNSIQRDGNLPF
ncbi:unnamed protein product, partial [Didymodactylos carnosus]